MRNGTKPDLAYKLMYAITPNTKRADIIKMVRAYWEHQDNKAARNNYPDDKNFGVKIANIKTTDILIERAKINCDFYDALKNRLVSKLESNELITEIDRKSLLFLLTTNRPKNKRKKTQASFHMGVQLAYCVNAIDIGTDSKFSWTSPDKIFASNMDRSLFALIAEATNVNENCIRKAWKDYKKLCQLKRKE